MKKYAITLIIGVIVVAAIYIGLDMYFDYLGDTINTMLSF